MSVSTAAAGVNADYKNCAPRCTPVRQWPVGTEDDRCDKSFNEVVLALAVNGQRRSAEAQQLVAPIVTYHRALAARNHGDQQQKLEMAVALYAQRMSDPGQRVAGGGTAGFSAGAGACPAQQVAVARENS